MILILKYALFILGVLFLFWVNTKLKREKTGDERTRYITQLAGWSAWNVLTIVAGLQTILLITQVQLPFLKQIGPVAFPVLFAVCIIFYLISYIYHSIRTSA